MKIKLQHDQCSERQGNAIVFAAINLVLLFAFTAFTVDIGYITLTKAELQKTADAASLAAVLEMYEGYGVGSQATPSAIDAAARLAAKEVAAANRSGGVNSTYLDQVRDVRLGQYQWDATNNTWVEAWGVAPYNLVEVTVNRNQAGSTNGDGPLDLFFAPIMGTTTANTHAVAKSAMKPGVGFKVLPTRNVGVLPITLDVVTWNNLMAGVGSDNYSFNETTGVVSSGSDSVLEVNLYPTGNPKLPAGNRGTVDFGSSGNSTADIKRQILYGLNQSDLNFLGGQLNFDDLPMQINGDTGLSAGIKAELDAIKGQPRMIPLFSVVSGPGNNAYYTIVKFVPIRILYVQLTGKPSDKRVIVQPATYTDVTIIAGETVIQQDSVFAPSGLIR